MPTTSDELTPAMVRRYIDSEGSCCPYCGSDEIEAGPVEADADSSSGDVMCNACGKQWRDVYTLSAIDVLDENGRYKTTIGPGEENEAEEAGV